MKSEIIFAQTISVVELNLDTASIIDYCLEKRNEDPVGRVLSNKGGWQSNDLYGPQPKIKELQDAVMNYANIFSNTFSLNKRIAMGNFWININDKGNINSAHAHPNSMIAAVYYAKVPPNSGHIQFHSPLSTYDNYLNHNQIKSYNMFNSSRYNHFPKANELLIFPSWLTHSVYSNESDESRISIAFNFSI